MTFLTVKGFVDKAPGGKNGKWRGGLRILRELINQLTLSRTWFTRVRKVAQRCNPWLSRKHLEFLPPAQEILKTPASPIRMMLAFAICCFAIIAFAASWIFTMDIYAVAVGRIQPVGRSKLIQPLETGSINNIFVHEGSAVSAGTVLLELDPTEANADQDAVLAHVQALDAEIAGRKAALAVVEEGDLTRLPITTFPASVSVEFREREREAIDADFKKLVSDCAFYDAKVSESLAQERALTNTIASEDLVIDTLQRRFRMRSELQTQGWESLSDVLDVTESLQREFTARANNEGQLKLASAEAISWRKQGQQTLASFISSYSQSVQKAQDDRDAALQDLTKAGNRVHYTKLISPIDGTVQQLTATTIGQVVLPGQQLMTIVPKNNRLELEALVQSADIGFVKVGDPVVIKIDAFPYTKYGTVGGVVEHVSRDSLESQQAMTMVDTQQKASGNAGDTGAAPVPETQQLVFPVIVSLDGNNMVIDGKVTQLSPGMSATVDIETGSRTILDYIMSPLAVAKSEAGHER